MHGAHTIGLTFAILLHCFVRAVHPPAEVDEILIVYIYTCTHTTTKTRARVCAMSNCQQVLLFLAAPKFTATKERLKKSTSVRRAHSFFILYSYPVNQLHDIHMLEGIAYTWK